MPDIKIKPKERDTVIQCLRTGVIPRLGQHHIQVGRAREVEALVKDIDRVADGGATVRFVIGEYGSGKTFFLNLIRSIALERKLVTIHADLTVDRRLQATGGQARSLYAELMRNMATRSKPDGSALPSVVERFVTSALQEAEREQIKPELVIRQRMTHLAELVGGYDFAEVIAQYWRGHDTSNETLKSDALRWLRGEFATKTDARNALGVRTIVTDANVYDQLKLLSVFVRLSGFSGLLICLDEMVNLYKMTHTQSRNANYEQILRIVNDSLQGTAAGLGFLFGGTPEFLGDTRRGLYSYAALQSRLAENQFLKHGLVDYSAPVLRLASLSQEELYVLLSKLRHVYANGDERAYLVPDEALTAFMSHCSQKIGDAYFRTPRSTIKAFLDMLAVLEQNSRLSWKEFIDSVELPEEANPDLAPIEDDEIESTSNAKGDALADFKL